MISKSTTLLTTCLLLDHLLQAVTAQKCSNLRVDSNVVNINSNAGFTLTNCKDTEIVSNRIGNCQKQGILQTNSQGSVRITNNVLLGPYS
ncbi:MAG TPA: right-handed parallel beta-helix repeat-containing protein [Trichormus sp.]